MLRLGLPGEAPRSIAGRSPKVPRMPKVLGVALLGSKFMGRAHSNAWLKVGRFFDLPRSPAMRVVAARDAADLAPFAARWGWERWTTDWREAARAEDVDLVDIGTPNHVHCDQALAALAAGKHVACEKPLAGTLDHAREMRRAAREAPGRTFVWFNYRRVPAVAFAHQLVAEGRLGRIYHVRAQYLQSWGGPGTPLLWRFRKGQAGTGAHGDLNAHIVDMARFVTGDEITEVAGAIAETFVKERPLPDDPERTGRSTVDDAVLFLARFKGGAVATFEATRLATGYRNANRLEVHGERGAISFDFTRMNELRVYDATGEGRTAGWTTVDVTREADGHPYAGHWWPESHGLGYEHGFVNQAADIVKAISRRRPEVPLPDFEDAYQTQRVLEAAFVSARERAPVKLSQVR